MNLRRPTHVGHVVRVDRVDHRAGGEEQQRLEEGVGEEVEQTGGVGAGTHRHHHVAELRQRRVGEHLLDVVGYQGYQTGEEQGQRADDDDDPAHIVGEPGRVVEREEATEQVDTGGDHGGGVHERRDRGRAGHGIGQPHVQRELGALAHRPDKDGNACPEAVLGQG